MREFKNLDLLENYLNDSLKEYEDYFEEVIFFETGYKFADLPESAGIAIKYNSEGKFFVEDVKQAAATGLVFISLAKTESIITRIFNCYESILICFGYIKSLDRESTIYSEDKTFSEYMSKNGSKGAAIKNEPMRKLKAFAINLSKDYPSTKSANSIAFEIKSAVYEQGRILNAHLSLHNAQDTIKKWINEYRNKSRVASS